MGDTAHVLEASITSALALKPSTVYVLRVENRANGTTWHLRKCFSDFSELRDKVIGLIESTAGASIGTSPAASHISSCSSSVYDTGGSHTSCSSSGSSDVTLPGESSTPTSFSERFPHLFKQFPRRQLFGSRSKKVIEHRTRSLNAFVHELLLYARDVRQQNQIAVYFGLRGFVEGFFECTDHSAVVTVAASSPYLPIPGLRSPSTLAKTQAAAAAAARAAAVVVVGPHGIERRPAHAPFSFSDDSDDENDDTQQRNNASASGKRGVQCARRFYQEYGKPTVSGASDGEDDADEHKIVGLKKTSSCMAYRELREVKMHFTGSHYAPLQATGAADAWAARVEIAGIPPIAGRVHQSQAQPQSQPRSATLAISAHRVQRRPVDEPPPVASLVYAAPKSGASAAKTRFRKDGSDRHHTRVRQAAAVREERPEWA